MHIFYIIKVLGKLAIELVSAVKDDQIHGGCARMRERYHCASTSTNQGLQNLTTSSYASSQPSSLFDSSTLSSVSSPECDQSSHSKLKPFKPSQPFIIEEPSESEHISPDIGLDRLISLSTQMLASSTAALASTIATRSSISSLTKIEHTLDRTIRTHERTLRRRLDTVEENKLKLDSIGRELNSWHGEHHNVDQINHEEEAAQLTKTIVSAERARMKSESSHPRETSYRPLVSIRQPKQSTTYSNTLHINADGCLPKPSSFTRKTSSTHSLRHSISHFNSTTRPPSPASSLLNSLSITSPPKLFHKRSSSSSFLSIKQDERGENHHHHHCVSILPITEEDSQIHLLSSQRNHQSVNDSSSTRYPTHRHLNYHHDYHFFESTTGVGD
ncbi:uncharacterized protein MELLADRAFT_118012 [Melampsora larici-populina 98AG31]|uniref:Uncharacterized protein n=1 Tax=Melampsora larici-populina (strain 98AG31 / pathotype 3-4-7) TaxID=747676 RepID=F4S438_MELLP|nr:uncharacterized protein MELLADRAFT_118012 [Melampsora larici-populina 98AG31]EGG00517.1 hypothetical protein MELLADRAFT_118012 [Melampsora larici-populina 98AG31]